MYVHKNNTNDPRLFQEVPRELPKRLMVWGCITYHGLGDLYKFEENVNWEEYCKALGISLQHTIDVQKLDKNIISSNKTMPLYIMQKTY
jgi:hypothetical protein